MTCSAARMRSRLLAAAPATVLGSLFWHAGGAGAALLLWLGIGALLPCHERYPYPRKRRLRMHQLFFCFSLTAFIISGAGWVIRRFFLNGAPSPLRDLLTYAGAAGFALPIGKRALGAPLPARLSWVLGALLTALFAYFA